ncbi:T9SS type A sorting domain-containing protein [Lishizhenia sp.]|uniref:T9SS type A sorting domain-containing protein n=1 Tax=Lishizhenia sp. TaxID=2497594 RepID=UPI00299EA1A5|nr:T9SS type A sorting domain-containing protein [Lishizhenia sp.]MDX1446209.1 T9SS type A sorting domain-containing protein [Lishizhenia sp.]
MKRTITLMFVILTSIVWSQELAPAIKSWAKNHLLTVNSQWTYFQDQLPQEEVFFNNDTERIAYHLDNVCRLLKAQNTEHLSAEQLENRMNTISILEGYAARKVFPTNHYHVERQPYFIDNYGVHCAVGYLVKETGYPEISKEIARTQNYAYVKEIQSEALLQWAKDYGFSVQELALIQPAYAPMTTLSNLGTGANGEVVDLFIAQQYPNDLVIAGNFTELGGIQCVNIGMYKQGNFSCFGSGLDGIVEGVHFFRYMSGEPFLRVFGDFEENGVHYPYAEFKNGSWSLKEIPQRINTNSTIITGWKDDFFVGIPVTGELHAYEVYSVLNDSVSLYAEIYGELYTMNGGYLGEKTSFGGDFDSLRLVNEDTIILANNVLLWHNNQYVTVHENIIDKVYNIQPHGTSVILSGNAELNSSDDFSKPLITRYVLGTNQAIINLSYLYNPYQNTVYNSFIYSTKIIGNWLYAAGDVEKSISPYDGGRGVLRINLITGIFEFVMCVDNNVNDIEFVDGELIVGGDFTENRSDWPLDFQSIQMLGKANENYSGIDSFDQNEMNVSPNPVQGNASITLNLPETVTISSLKVIDMKGSSSELVASKEIQLPNLKSGTYILVVQTSDGNIYREKLIVQ